MKDPLSIKNFKDPLSSNDTKENVKTIVKGAIVLGIGIPLLVGLSSLIGGTD
jgi:hypothetical protein